MATKAILFVCAQALVLQSISAQYAWAAPRAATPCCGNYGVDLSAISTFEASHGGSLPITSTSSIAPSGISVVSDNAYKGDLNICGGVPFLGAVALEGCLPTAGDSAVTYGCGCGEVAITEETAAAPAVPVACSAPYAYGKAGRAAYK